MRSFQLISNKAIWMLHVNLTDAVNHALRMDSIHSPDTGVTVKEGNRIIAIIQLGTTIFY